MRTTKGADLMADKYATHKDFLHFAHLALSAAELSWQQGEQERTVELLRQAEGIVTDLLKRASA